MEPVYWHWVVLGLGLIALEMLMSAEFVLLFLGVSAILVGLLAWVVPMGWAMQVGIFGVISVASIFGWRRWRPQDEPTDQPMLNRRGDTYLGRTFVLAEPIVAGVGRLRVDDGQWRVTGADAPAGARVRVAAVDGATLKVERIE